MNRIVITASDILKYNNILDAAANYGLPVVGLIDRKVDWNRVGLVTTLDNPSDNTYIIYWKDRINKGE